MAEQEGHRVVDMAVLAKVQGATHMEVREEVAQVQRVMTVATVAARF